MQRRNFIKISSFTTGGWLLAQLIPLKSLGGATADPTCFQPSPLIKMCNDGKIYIYVLKQESGQGVQTSLPMILAEELEADPKDIIIEALPFDASKGGQYGTGGSTSVMTQYMPLRKAGATAREMLISAAAIEWVVPSSQCRAEKSKVTDTVSGKELTYAQLYAKAAKLEVPKNPSLKNYKDFKIIGKQGQKKTNIKNIVTGKFNYGIDLKIPGMLYGAVVRCPVMEGKLKSFDEKSVKDIEGIIKLVEMKEMGINNRNGVGIIATNRWSAMKAAQQLKVEWDLGKHANANSKQYSADLRKLFDGKPDVSIDANSKDAELIVAGAKTVTAEYELQFVAHATMEPVNCTAQFKDGKFELWGGFQSPSGVSSQCSKYFGLKATDVFINLQPMGGGFGRKLATDYSGEAMQLSTHADGKPVQLLYSRADDIKYDVFRPASVHRLRSEFDSDGLPTNWEHKIAISPVNDFQGGRKGSVGNIKGELGGGADGDMYYHIPTLRAAGYKANSPIPEGWWRAVNFTYNNFVIESFIDELALKLKKDPLEYRIFLLEKKAITTISGATYKPERLQNVLKEAANLIGWKNKRPTGRGVGIACCFYNHAMAYTAHAFDITVDKNKKITIHKAVCVTDVGTVIDPDGLENQIQGGFIWGLSEVLKSEITIDNGVVQQNHFNDFEVMRMGQLPPFEIKIINSIELPGGAGETSVPSVKPALCNAIAAACNIRVRKLPIKNAGFEIKLT
jgi:isoquinoline 1-oxidoreductase beta subunit